MVKGQNIWALGFLLIFLAILIPFGINTFNDSGEIDHVDTFIAATTTTDAQYQLNAPIVLNSEVIKINDATQTKDVGYTISYTTGLLTISTQTVDDVIEAAYTEDVDFGSAGALWFLIPTFVLLLVVYGIYRSSTRGRRGKMGF